MAAFNPKDYDYTCCVLEDDQLNFYVDKWHDARLAYGNAYKAYKGYEFDTTTPKLVKTFEIEDGTCAEYYTTVYTSIQEYIEEEQKEGVWEFSHIKHEDCFIPWGNMSNKVVNVYAFIYDKTKADSTQEVRVLQKALQSTKDNVESVQIELMRYLKSEGYKNESDEI